MSRVRAVNPTLGPVYAAQISPSHGLIGWDGMAVISDPNCRPLLAARLFLDLNLQGGEGREVSMMISMIISQYDN